MIYIAVKFNDIQSKNISVREKGHLESSEAYSLLSVLYETIFSAKMPKIKRDGRGKPHFFGECMPSFNISHTQGASLAVIDTLGDDIGADIQIKVSEDRAKRICTRFPFVIKKRSCLPLPRYTLLQFDEKSSKLFPLCEKIAEKDLHLSDFSAKWALTEAILKAEGGGFASAPVIDNIKDIYSLSLIVKNDAEYFLSVARLNGRKNG